jgi:outer membrane protein
MPMKWVVLALLLLGPVPSLAAQETPRALSLDDALRLAQENNPLYRQAQNSVESAAAVERQNRAAFLPSLSLSLSSGGFLSRRFTGLDQYGKPIRRADPLEYTGSSSSQGLSLGLQLFDGGARFHELRAARAQKDAAEASVLSEASTLRAELARRYYEARRRTELIRTEEALLQAARSRETAWERLLRVASATPVDLLGAQVETARQERALEQARGEARKAMLALAEEIGVPAAGTWTLTTDAPAVFDPASLAADSLVERALAVSPRMLQLRAEERAAEQQRRAAGATRWPTISTYASIGRSIGAEGYEALFEPNPLDQSLGFGLSVSLPLFTRFQTTARITQARVAALNAREDARATRLALEREVRSALIDLKNAHRTVQLAERSRELAGRRLELANQQFRIGSLKFVELQSVIEQAATAERDAVNARYDFAAALATLEERIGGPLATPAGPIP